MTGVSRNTKRTSFFSGRQRDKTFLGIVAKILKLAIYYLVIAFNLKNMLGIVEIK